MKPIDILLSVGRDALKYAEMKDNDRRMLIKAIHDIEVIRESHYFFAFSAVDIGKFNNFGDTGILMAIIGNN